MMTDNGRLAKLPKNIEIENKYEFRQVNQIKQKLQTYSDSSSRDPLASETRNQQMWQLNLKI